MASVKISKEELRRLSVAERIQLVDEIWDSILSEDHEVPLTEAQRRELDRRLQEYAKDPAAGRPWEDVRKSLE